MRLSNVQPYGLGRESGDSGGDGERVSEDGGNSDGGSSPSLTQSYGEDNSGGGGIGITGVANGIISAGSRGTSGSVSVSDSAQREYGYYYSTVGGGDSGGDAGSVGGSGGTGADFNNNFSHIGVGDDPVGNNNDNSGSNRTLSEFLSLVEDGAASLYNGVRGGESRTGSTIDNKGHSGGDGNSLSSLGEQLGVDRLVNNYNDHNYNNVIGGGGAAGGGGGAGSILDYDYTDNNGHILFDNGLGFVHTNVSLSYLDSFSQQLFDQIEFRMGDDLTRYVCPAIIVLGNISNFVAFLVLRRKKFKNSSVAFYMRAYALANLCFLDLMLGIAWLCLVLEIQYLAHRTDWSCRLWTFISNVITYSGIWFVVVMSIDRFVYTNLPNKASGYCSVFTAKGITTFVLICLIVVSIHAMWTFELQPQGCWVSHQQDDLHKLTWPWWSAALYSYIPLLLLLVMIIAQSVSYCVRVFMKRPHSPPNARQAVDHDSLVKPVFLITVAFFFLTIPSTAINLLDIHLPSNLLRVDVIAKIELTKKITELLSSFNNSLLGIVLVALSPAYQTELLGLCRAIFCCTRTRKLKVLEMRNISGSDDNSSPHTQADYELCNNNDDNLATDV